MKTKTRIEDKYGAKLPIKRKIAAIVNLLFEIEEIKKKSAISPYDVETLSFDVVLTDDAEIHNINKEYRKKDAPTDVITFALFADDENKFIFNKTVELGEIIISIDTAKRQMQKDLPPFEALKKEVLTLICHGILHLLGFDHLTNKDYNFVVGIQDSIISKL